MVVPEFRGFPFVVNGTDRFYVLAGKKRYLDFSGSAMTTGYDFLKSVDLVSPVSTLVFRSAWNERLTKMLKQISGMKNVVYCTSGTEACEATLSRYERPIIALENAYHGKGYLSYRASNGAGIDKRNKMVHLKVPQDPEEESNVQSHNEKLISDAAKAFDIEGSTLIFELVQSDGGVNVLSDGFISSLRKIASEHHMHMAIDEVYTGMGRSGELLLSLKKRLNPDMICIGKGMAAGLPLSAVLYGGNWNISYNGAFGMQSGNMLCSRAAVKTISGLTEKRLSFVRKKGKEIIKRLSSISNNNIKSVRGIGFMIGVELTKNGKPLTDYTYELRSKLLKKGVVCSLVGAKSNIVKITPPPYIDEKTLDEGINRISAVLGE
ncbi:MAG: aminotransferase class III-fold pyridoxal phosphate-dependent enzyme [Candidatus Micrarchaeales archaeon]|jgi:4-aminobutyrate aminotransferase-like enzyme|nr:aminotransferase class III-fold pyridoxal phosphate-dependent enzyme [Candidatus Micrarchaeales archaeon]